MSTRFRTLLLLPLLLAVLAGCNRSTVSGRVDELTLTDRIDASGRPVRALRSFSAGTETIYAVAVVSGAVAGERVQARWYLGSALVQESPSLALPDGGARYVNFTLYRRGNSFPAGNFRVEVLVGGHSQRSAEFVVG